MLLSAILWSIVFATLSTHPVESLKVGSMTRIAAAYLVILDTQNRSADFSARL